MDPIFCCSSVQPYRHTTLDHEHKFRAFKTWVAAPHNATKEAPTPEANLLENKATYILQVVRQINFGPLESKRYFARGDEVFHEVTEKDLVDANYQKLNAYKNFKCTTHNKFFEFNIYEKDPVNKHHWRANIARPPAEIDLASKSNQASDVNKIESPKQSPNAVINSTDLKSSSNINQTSDTQKVSSPVSSAGLAEQAIASLSLEDNTPLESSVRGPSDDEEGDRSYFKDLNWRGRDYYNRYDGSPAESEKDFTACSSEDCGNCGHCPY